MQHRGHRSEPPAASGRVCALCPPTTVGGSDLLVAQPSKYRHAVVVKNKITVLSLFLVLPLCLVPGSGARQASAPLKTSVTFEEVPPKASGITWVHNNAHSQERYLPETVGAGCAFLDYDNDGWVDIYLVNSGPSDFFKPQTPLKNALYRNNRDGTFTDVTEKAGVAGGTLRLGAGGGGVRGGGGGGFFVAGSG